MERPRLGLTVVLRAFETERVQCCNFSSYISKMNPFTPQYIPLSDLSQTPLAVIDKRFCAGYPLSLTVKEEILSISRDDFSVYTNHWYSRFQMQWKGN